MLTLKPLYTPYLESLTAHPGTVLAEHPNHAKVAELATEVATATLDLYAQTGATEPLPAILQYAKPTMPCSVSAASSHRRCRV